jgi:hypothetical protein
VAHANVRMRAGQLVALFVSMSSPFVHIVYPWRLSAIGCRGLFGPHFVCGPGPAPNFGLGG